MSELPTLSNLKTVQVTWKTLRNENTLFVRHGTVYLIELSARGPGWSLTSARDHVPKINSSSI